MAFLRVKDVGGSPTWRRIVLFLAHTPGRRFHIDEIVDHVYGDRPDGGPDNPQGALRVIFYRFRDCVPPGWRLISKATDPGHGYGLRWIGPAESEAA